MSLVVVGGPLVTPMASWPSGLPRRFTKLDPGMDTRFSRAPGTLDYCSRTETTKNKMMSGLFLALATIHMFVQEKKVGARRRGCLPLKKSPFVPATVARLFREFILKVQLPQQHGQGQCQFGVCQHSSLSRTRCGLHRASAYGRPGIHWTCYPPG